MSATVLDVIDNFFNGEMPDFDTIPGTTLFGFGDEVRRFAASKPQREIEAEHNSIYLGGWPSANFWTVYGQMLFSSLLYTDQVLVRDPIADWFCTEQYEVPHKMSSRPGFLKTNRSPNVGSTRAFLANVVPSLYALRPLIDSNIIVMAPAERFYKQHEETIRVGENELFEHVIQSYYDYVHKFSPTDIAVEDNVRGMFLFTGGERDDQVQKAISDGLRYFSREYSFASAHGAVYTAPFEHEQYLVRGVESLVRPTQRVVRGIFASNLPLFSNLTPKLITKIHNDDNFASFRSQLHTVYEATPIERSEDDIESYIMEQEQALLTPAIERATRTVEKGAIGRLGIRLAGPAIGFGLGMVANTATGSPVITTGAGIAGPFLQAAWESRRKPRANPVWAELVKHHRSHSQEMKGIRYRQSTGAESAYWGHPGAARTNTVTISEGNFLVDYLRPSRGPSVEHSVRGYTQGVYHICECGSGLKYKFCCKDVRTP